MRATPRRHLSRASLALLLTVDLLALLAFLFDQLLAIGTGVAWLLAAGVTATAMPGLLRLVDRVFAAAREAGNGVISGGTFP